MVDSDRRTNDRESQNLIEKGEERKKNFIDGGFFKMKPE